MQYQYENNVSEEASDFLTLERERELGAVITSARNSLSIILSRKKIEMPKSYKKFKALLKNLNGSFPARDKSRISELEQEIKEAVNEFVLHNQLLARYTMPKFSRNNVFVSNNQEDYANYGIIGIMEAAWRYDGRGRFSTYATWWVRQTAARGSYEIIETITIPAGRREKLRREEETEKTDADYNQKALKTRLISSINARNKDDDIIIELPSKDWKERAEMQIDINNLIQEILSSPKYSEREKAIFRERYIGPMQGEKKPTLEDVGRSFNLTRERVRQIEAKFLRKLVVRYKEFFYD